MEDTHSRMAESHGAGYVEGSRAAGESGDRCFPNIILALSCHLSRNSNKDVWNCYGWTPGVLLLYSGSINITLAKERSRGERTTMVQPLNSLEDSQPAPSLQGIWGLENNDRVIACPGWPWSVSVCTDLLTVNHLKSPVFQVFIQNTKLWCNRLHPKRLPSSTTDHTQWAWL